MKRSLLIGLCLVFIIIVVISPKMAIAVDNEDSLIDDLMRGEFYNAIITPYTQTLGPFFHIMVFLLGPTLVGIKFQRFAPVGMVILITGIVFATFFESPVQFFFATAAILGMAGIFYSVVHK